MINATTMPPLPSYRNPPVIEVVCGFQFKPIPDFGIAHVGLLWQRFQSEYPISKDQQPLAPLIEVFGPPPLTKQEQVFRLGGMPRTWFVSEDQSHIIQIQPDRFLTNWKKASPVQPYPRYHHVIENFENKLERFNSFLADSGLSAPVPVQYELTYVNIIKLGEGWSAMDRLSELFPDFAWRPNKHWLPSLEGINWATSFELPDQMARLHVHILSGWTKSDQEILEPIMQLSLTVRGIGEYSERMREWFDIARRWIVLGFEDLTSTEVQKSVWGKE